MSTTKHSVIVVRHAQASVHAADYDQLSELGVRQAEQLGRYFASHRMQFGAVVSGAMRRHAQSLEAIAIGMQAPEQCSMAEFSADLNEYDFRAVLGAFAEQFPEHLESVQIRPLSLLKQALSAWARGQIAAPGLESYADFQIRVARGFKRIASVAEQHVSSGSQLPTLVLTSGGVISALLQRALGLEDQALASINLAIKNCSISEFLLSQRAWHLQSFNTLPHLSAPEFREWHTRV